MAYGEHFLAVHTWNAVALACRDVELVMEVKCDCFVVVGGGLFQAEQSTVDGSQCCHLGDNESPYPPFFFLPSQS